MGNLRLWSLSLLLLGRSEDVADTSIVFCTKWGEPAWNDKLLVSIREFASASGWAYHIFSGEDCLSQISLLLSNAGLRRFTLLLHYTLRLWTQHTSDAMLFLQETASRAESWTYGLPVIVRGGYPEMIIWSAADEQFISPSSAVAAMPDTCLHTYHTSYSRLLPTDLLKELLESCGSCAGSVENYFQFLDRSTHQHPTGTCLFGSPGSFGAFHEDAPWFQTVRAEIAELLQTQFRCELVIVGAGNGPYRMCKEYLEGIEVAYSYGIEGVDEWGEQLSKALSIPVHQYDCTNPKRPECAGCQFVFHDECLGSKEGLALDSTYRVPFAANETWGTLLDHLTANDDHLRMPGSLVAKIDIESWEWLALPEVDDSVWKLFRMVNVELHDVMKDPVKQLEMLRQLSRSFVVVDMDRSDGEMEVGDAGVGDLLVPTIASVSLLHKDFVPGFFANAG